jgi:large subunit ribosomal protein L15
VLALVGECVCPSLRAFLLIRSIFVLQQAGIAADALAAKIVLSARHLVRSLRGVGVTKGAKAAIEAAGGSVESAE